MKRGREEMATEDVAVSLELKRKDCDAQLKQEGPNMLKSPVAYVSAGNDWHESSRHAYTDTIGGQGLSRCVTSLNGSKSPCTTPSINDVGRVVEELTVRNYKNLSLAAVSSSISKEAMQSRQGQWNYLYHLASGSRGKNSHENFMFPGKDQIKEDMRRLPYNSWDMNTLSRKQINQGSEEISTQLMNSDNNIVSSKIPPPSGTRSKMLSASGFSHFFAMKTFKGKGVACKSPEACNGFGNAIVGQNNENSVHLTRVAYSALLNSSTNNHQPSPLGSNRAVCETFHDGISLREWLKPGCRNISKPESLHLFRQIVELVDFAHSQKMVLQDLRPSCFILLSENRIKYIGSSSWRELEMHQNTTKKRPLEQDMDAYGGMGAKQQKLSDEIDIDIANPQDIGPAEHNARNNTHYSANPPKQQPSVSVNLQLEANWYNSPEVPNEKRCTFSSNIYSLGVLLFELLGCFESWEEHSAVMLELRHRILPPNFLSEHSMEAGFCLWLLHPEPSSRPSTREILQSELFCGSQELYLGDNSSLSADDDDAESEQLLDFLISLKEQKEKHASKLVENIGCLEADIKEVERRHLLRSSPVHSWTHKCFPNAREQRFHLEGHIGSGLLSRPLSAPNMNEARLMRNINQLENAYFAMRSQLQLTETATVTRSDKDLLKNRERWFQKRRENEELSLNQKPADHLGNFFAGLCKFARYSKLEVCGTLRNGDLLNSTNVICSLSFCCDEDYIAVAGVSKKIKIFEFGALLNDSVDIHYPVIEMSNKSKLSCVCWNNYIRNYLASTDYDGVVQMWDAGTGQGFSQYMEHEKRAWSVDFSQVDPTKFASGSDDCSVKLWSINEKNSTSTIWNRANVCCVQFSAYSSHLLAFGSADYKIYCYDLRHTRIPWCTLAGHGKAVSYVKFLDSETLVSASTDNTLKLWDLNKTSSSGLSSSACSLTFRGHTNEKNFVGLSVLDGYIACGSETNEVYTYYKSLPMPITSHKFGSIDPISGHEISDDNAQFVSSVCWGGKSNMVVAANSTGNIKLLQMV